MAVLFDLDISEAPALTRMSKIRLRLSRYRRFQHRRLFFCFGETTFPQSPSLRASVVRGRGGEALPLLNKITYRRHRRWRYFVKMQGMFGTHLLGIQRLIMSIYTPHPPACLKFQTHAACRGFQAQFPRRSPLRSYRPPCGHAVWRRYLPRWLQ